MSWMLFHLCGRGLSPLNISSQHTRHRKYRKLITTGLNATSMKSYWPVMQEEAQILIGGLISEPDKLVTHIRRCVHYADISESYRRVCSRRIIIQECCRSNHDGCIWIQGHQWERHVYSGRGRNIQDNWYGFGTWSLDGGELSRVSVEDVLHIFCQIID